MTTFLITFTHVEGAAAKLTEDEVPKMIQAHQEWTKAVREKPNSSLVYFAGAEEARTVRRDEDGKLEVLDGPFTQGPEASGGFFIIEAESLDEAVEFAARFRWLPGSNEVREIRTPDSLSAWIGTRLAP